MQILAKLAAIITIIMGILNGWRSVAQFQQRDVLIEYGASLPIGLIASISMFWAIVLIGGGVVAWRQPARMKLLIPLLFLTYTLYSLWLPTETLPSLYGHLFLTIFTALALRFSGRDRPLRNE